MPDTTLVVPCYDEASRLRPELFEAYCLETPGMHFLFVDDGSRDGTLAVLQDLVARLPSQLAVLGLQPNRGKAEAVRAGMREALGRGHDFVGYWDADLATPLDELARFVDLMERRTECQIVFGSRVQLLGRTIERNVWRHYAGRVFATATSQVLGLSIYDTQCGAKLFRSTPEVAGLFEQPFRTSWVFDVELVARWLQHRRARLGAEANAAICELPLHAWRDVPGSKVRPWDFVRALRDLARIWRAYPRGAR
jgi:glycosyltransferase involved in cell wall biosynthesis